MALSTPLVGPLHEADIAPLAVLAFAAWQKGIAPHLPPAARVRIRPAMFEWLMRAEEHLVLVAYLDGEPAGLIAQRLGENHISDLWVGPAFEHRGAGRALLAAMEAVLRRRGHQEATIQVLAANRRALDLYQRQGYETVWRKIKEDRLLRVALDKVELRKRLVQSFR